MIDGGNESATYSANDHAGDTVGLIMEVINEAIDQTETPEAERRLQEMRAEAEEIRQLIIENEGETPTQSLVKALEARNE